MALAGEPLGDGTLGEPDSLPTEGAIGSALYLLMHPLPRRTVARACRRVSAHRQRRDEHRRNESALSSVARVISVQLGSSMCRGSTEGMSTREEPQMR